MRRAIILFLDGTRRDMISEEHTPALYAAMRKMTRCDAHRSMFPSATRVVSASVATGCHPARHELQGNSMALSENGRLVLHDAGHPEFLQHKRHVTGRSLAVPTMAERLKDAGGAVIYANVSPGAAYAHDPDGFGHIYHRAGSYGPGRRPVEGWNASEIPQGIDGDDALTERFVEQAVLGGRAALSLMWLAEPDVTQHAYPLGSPQHLAILKRADANARKVIEAVEAARSKGEDILFLLGSDHGHQTVSEVVDIEGALIAAGLKEGSGSGDVVAVSSGTSALIQVNGLDAGRIARIGTFLREQPWADRVFDTFELAGVGQAHRHGIVFAVAMAHDERPNTFGVPGHSYEAMPAPGKATHQGCGQHGGLARYEQMPFLMLQGPGFEPGAARWERTAPIDIAPTVLTHLDIPFAGLDGRALQKR